MSYSRIRASKLVPRRSGKSNNLVIVQYFLKHFLQVLENIATYWSSDKLIKARAGELSQNMKSGNPKGIHKEESCQACAERVCQHYRTRLRFNSGNVSLQEYEQEEQEEQEVSIKKREEIEHLTSDYESECELTPSYDIPAFRRSFSMPAKSMTMVDSPIFFYET